MEHYSERQIGRFLQRLQSGQCGDYRSGGGTAGKPVSQKCVPDEFVEVSLLLVDDLGAGREPLPDDARRLLGGQFAQQSS